MNKNLVVVIALVVIVVTFSYISKSIQVDAPYATYQEEQKNEVMVPKKTVSTKPVVQEPVTVTNTVTAPESSRLVVTYTDQGFSPSVREVKRGEELTFINDSSKGMRVTSFPIANQGYYTGFIQTKTVARGGIYKFTFLEVGSWNYQNLNYENDKGVIVVK